MSVEGRGAEGGGGGGGGGVGGAAPGESFLEEVDSAGGEERREGDSEEALVAAAASACLSCVGGRLVRRNRLWMAPGAIPVMLGPSGLNAAREVPPPWLLTLAWLALFGCIVLWFNLLRPKFVEGLLACIPVQAASLDRGGVPLVIIDSFGDQGLPGLLLLPLLALYCFFICICCFWIE